MISLLLCRESCLLVAGYSRTASNTSFGFKGIFVFLLYPVADTYIMVVPLKWRRRHDRWSGVLCPKSVTGGTREGKCIVPSCLVGIVLPLSIGLQAHTNENSVLAV